MRNLRVWIGILAAAPLMGQAWDLRVEAPFATGQGLPSALVQGVGALSGADNGGGRGAILTLNHRWVRVNPVLRLDWTLEYSDWRTTDQAVLGGSSVGTKLTQSGLGAGLNAQFWIPFTGVAGEVGVIQRFQDYRYTVAGASEDRHISRTWLRVGARWRIPAPVVSPYFAISYQRPISKDTPQAAASSPSLGSYLAAQGAGQEFDRVWTFGVGVQF